MDTPRLPLTLAFLAATAVAQASNAPIAIALMSGFNAGAVNGMTDLRSRLAAEFGNGAQGAPALSLAVFTYTDTTSARNFLAGFPTGTRRVLIGHSFGAAANFTVANSLAASGIVVDLQISIDHVTTSSPLSATTVTLPASILSGWSYVQTSTSFLEPVPVANIIGARRHVNVETLFGDTSIVHTSIDCDLRVHGLVVEHVRQLFEARHYVSSGDKLDLLADIDVPNIACTSSSGLAVSGVPRTLEVVNVPAGAIVTLRTVSSEGLFNTRAFGVLGQLFPTPTPPVPLLRGIAADLSQPALFLLNPAGFQSPPTTLSPLPSQGYGVSFCWPNGLQGTSLLLQTVVVDPIALNGLWATTQAIELRG